MSVLQWERGGWLCRHFVICCCCAPRSFRLVCFSSFQQHKVQEPGLVNFAEIDFLRMVSDEVENILLADAVDVVPVPIMPTRALEVILKPAVLYLADDLVVILAQAHLQVPHGVAVSHSP